MGGESNIKYSFDYQISYPLAKFIAPFFHHFKITPNMITFSNIIFRIYIIYIIIIDYKHKFLLPFLLLTNFFDALDGTIARKYNLTSKFGATLDHISDKIFWGILILIVLYKIGNKQPYFIITLFIFILMLFAILQCELKKKCFKSNFMEMNASLIIILFWIIFTKI